MGSVSTNLALLSRDLVLLQDVYLPTAGKPIDALREGLRILRNRFGDRIRIAGAGTTGSGRHLAGRVLGADLARNEITAQMLSSTFYDPEVDTIFEIGGQDSKFISVRNGILAGFEMNKICAGGTGSFLEEQAQRIGVRIVDEFAALALRSTRPCDLGARCTVFMDTELVRSLERGETREDICAGLAYSVARNYLEKVVAGRPVGKRIMIQGGTASNAAVVAAFRRILDRPVKVHPHNRVSGAIGAALLAARAGVHRSAFLGFDCCEDARIRSFECRHCENHCQVNRVQSGMRVAHFGDTCERYSEEDKEPDIRARPFPELFAARQTIFERFTKGTTHSGSTTRIGLIRSSLNLEFLPFWASFLRNLGFEPVISGQEDICEIPGMVPAEVCHPVKIAAAQVHALLAGDKADLVFLPAILECSPRQPNELSHTCLYSQQLPDILRGRWGRRVVSAHFRFREGFFELLHPSTIYSVALERTPDEIVRALRRARAGLRRFESERVTAGTQALATAFDRAVVVLGRPYNTHDFRLNLSLARRLERLGLPAIPWDMLPLEGVPLDDAWQNVPWHYSREQLRALEIVRRDPRLFPLFVSSYGCGPDGFLFKHFERMLPGRPRLFLEFDEHRGEAGLMTRLEAFADEIEAYLLRAEPARHGTAPTVSSLPKGRSFFVIHFAEHAHIYAAVLRAAGLEAEVLPPPDADTINAGEAQCSGRECHPYTVMAGETVRFARSGRWRPGSVLFLPSLSTPCLLRQFGDSYRMLLRDIEIPGLEL